jgi:hypothetical protein
MGSSQTVRSDAGTNSSTQDWGTTVSLWAHTKDNPGMPCCSTYQPWVVKYLYVSIDHGKSCGPFQCGELGNHAHLESSGQRLSVVKFYAKGETPRHQGPTLDLHSYRSLDPYQTKREAGTQHKATTQTAKLIKICQHLQISK